MSFSSRTTQAHKKNSCWQRWNTVKNATTASNNNNKHQNRECGVSALLVCFLYRIIMRISTRCHNSYWFLASIFNEWLSTQYIAVVRSSFTIVDIHWVGHAIHFFQNPISIQLFSMHPCIVSIFHFFDFSFHDFEKPLLSENV